MEVGNHSNNIACDYSENQNGVSEDHLDQDVDIAKELKEKLFVSSGCSLINGYNKTIADDIKSTEHPINGFTKCHNVDLPAANPSFRLNNDSVVACHQNSLSCDVHNTKSSSSQSSKCRANSDSVAGESNEHPVTVVEPENDQTKQQVTISYVGYESECQMPDIMRLIQKDLSEPYSIYTYRYFIHNWPKFCFLAYDGEKCVGAIVCKLDGHKHSRRGYIAMLAVDESYRKQKIGSNLVLKAINAMVQDNADEVVLETEITNKPALRLYRNLGFVRDKRLFRYYLNGVDALRLKLWLR